jgi:uncharacterized protein
MMRYKDLFLRFTCKKSSASGKALVDLVRVADLGIEDLAIQGDEESTPAFLERWQRVIDALNGGHDHATVTELSREHSPKMLFRQGPRGVAMTLDEQSAGTRSWLDLVLTVLDVLDSGTVLVADEIDTSLHPRLIARLVGLFRDERTNPHGAQLVFTTHDATLLGTSFGREVLERDQIWFVEKDSTGATRLFPLTDFHPRKQENTERRYLGGGYGAVPAVFSDTLVNELIAAREDLARAAS